ncbi:hypothetical protein [Microvirga sp. 2TAF3]|uniref:hypothetical protein n=1 Tax=Microvirga sp. 2TAF3 TaxID=3233014 RepID=UPI003F98F73D
MPVFDANALKTDPKGAAFLLSVLRQTSPTRSPCAKSVEPNQKPARVEKLREWRLLNVTAL